MRESGTTSRVTVKSRSRLFWDKVHFVTTLAWFLRVVLVFFQIFAGSLLGRCVFLVGSLRVSLLPATDMA